MALGEAASLIAMPGRLCENSQPVPVRNEDWAKYSAGLVDAAKACYQAAQAKSQDRVSECTDRLTDACDNCHKVYRDKPQK